MTDLDGRATRLVTEDEQAPVPASQFTKTPTFTAHNAARYQRRQLVADVQNLTGRALICYIDTSDEGISRDDTLGFADLLHNAVNNEPIDLLLHTGGGDIDAAEKLIKMVRDVASNAEFRIIVPDMAKSAGTLMALAADLILMSATSELGPIDPQILHVGANGEGCGSIEVSWLRCEDVAVAVFRVVNAFVLAAQVEAPVGFEVSAGDEGAEPEDGLGSFEAPSRARYVHSVLY